MGAMSSGNAEMSALLGPEFLVLRTFAAGMSRVCSVVERRSGRRMVAKTLGPPGEGDELKIRFEREARAWLALGRHRNIVEGVAYREIDGFPFLFLEYVDGPDLEELAAACGPLPLGQALELGAELLNALDRVHRTRLEPDYAGLVHRDVKPSNILVGRDRVLKLADFGLVKVLGGGPLTDRGRGLGTALYAAPEQLRSAADVDVRADLYSCGAVLYRLIAGRPPLVGGSFAELWPAIEATRPEPLPSLRADCPAELGGFVAALLEKQPAARPSTATDSLTRLKAIRARLPEDPAAHACGDCGLSVADRLASCPLCGRLRGRSAEL